MIIDDILEISFDDIYESPFKKLSYLSGQGQPPRSFTSLYWAKAFGSVDKDSAELIDCPLMCPAKTACN